MVSNKLDNSTCKSEADSSEVSDIAINDIYNKENFKKQGYKIIDMLANHLHFTVTKENETVLPNITPDEMLNNWSNDFPLEPENNFDELINKVLSMSNNLHHPRYVGHQVSSPLPIAVFSDLVSSFLNNSSAVYEMGPASTVMEKRVIQWMSKLIGYDNKADGFFTSGGTIGNLTCLLAARQAKTGFDVWNKGLKDCDQLAVLISEQAHYSSKRALQIMGLGEEGVIYVPSNHTYSMDTSKLEEKYNEAIKAGKKVIAVVGNACSTATGSYDDLEKIADFCEKYDLWFHIDGAHGASALISEKYSHLLKGAERADSIIWDAHKMMLMSALVTAVIFKDGNTSFEAFSQQASYVFEKDAKEEWYNLCHRTMECTKCMMVLKVYATLSVYGTKLFSNYINYTYDLTKQFATVIENTKDFELATSPQANIICFRYTGKNSKDLNLTQKLLRKELHKTESFYTTQTDLNSKSYIRCTIINPHTTMKELRELLFKLQTIDIT